MSAGHLKLNRRSSAWLETGMKAVFLLTKEFDAVERAMAITVTCSCLPVNHVYLVAAAAAVAAATHKHEATSTYHPQSEAMHPSQRHPLDKDLYIPRCWILHFHDKAGINAIHHFSPKHPKSVSIHAPNSGRPTTTARVQHYSY